MLDFVRARWHHGSLLLFAFVTTSALTPARAAEPAREAAAPAPTSFDIPAASLADAMSRFGAQSGMQLVYAPELARGLKTPALSGRLTIEAALDRLLEGSGLAWSYVNGNTIVLKKAETKPSPPKKSETSSGVSDSKDTDEIVVVGVPEILVKGSKSLNTDIQRTEDGIQPFVIFDAQDIASSGATNLSEFFRNRLPMNAQQGLASQVNASPTNAVNANNAGQINLRGLGTNQTLILVDGRRVPSLFTGGNFQQGSISGISPSMIERIEVLPATASGIYGGSATGGVINIILKRDYQGVDFQASYGNAFDFDVGTRQFGASGGLAFEEGRTRLTFGATYLDQDELLGIDRNEMGARSRSLLLANNPSTATTPIVGYTPNICATASATSTTCSAANLTLKPAFGGASLDSNRTFVPVGYTGVASDNAAGLVSNAGKYNVDMPANTFLLLQAPVSKSISLNVRREFTPRIEAFVDLYGDRTNHTFPTSAGRVINVPASSAANPFQQNIAVYLPTPALTAESESEVENQRARGGVIARLPKDWSLSLEATRSRGETPFVTRSFPAPAGDGLAYLQSIALRDPNAVPIDDPASRFPTQVVNVGPVRNDMIEFSSRAVGPLFRLPAGPLTVTGLAERRTEKIGFYTQEIDNTPAADSWLGFPPGRQEILSASLEARVPLVSNANGFAGARALELTIAARYDDYELTTGGSGVSLPSGDAPLPSFTFTTVGLHSTDYTAGLSFSPVEDLQLRASYGTGFLPPNLNQLVSGAPRAIAVVNNDIVPLRDPLRGSGALTGNASGMIDIAQSGNADIQPESSSSLAFGFVFRPRLAEGLRLSADYIQIEKTDEITAPGLQFVIDNEAMFPGRIQRSTDPATFGGFAVGPIVGIDRTVLNLAASQVNALDVQLDYDFDAGRLGNWRLYAIGTRTIHRESQTQPGTPVLESVGRSEGPLAWRGNFGIDWSSGPWALGWNAQYYDSYHHCSATTLAAACEALVLDNGGSDTVPSQVYHDLHATYRFDDSRMASSPLLSGTEISLAVQNALDKTPPVLAGVGLNYSTYGDPRLRRFNLIVRKNFRRAR